jgi:uncharacterized protein YegL
MENMISEVVFILDRSGSMYGLEKDTIGGYNSFLQKQKEDGAQKFITTVLFNDSISVIHKRAPIQRVADLTEKDYVPGGCTALLDAVGETIEEIARKQETWDEKKPDSTVVVIITDGKENSSAKYSYPEIKRMISAKREEGWKFVFLGANIDAPEVGERLGIRRGLSKNYHADSIGTNVNFEAVSSMVSRMSCMRMEEEDMEADLGSIDLDFFSRSEK